MSRVFFRVTRSDPPALADFTSNHALGRILPNPSAERIKVWQGISVFESEELARRKARSVPQIGQFIARLEIEDESGIESMPTFSKGHYTLWGLPEEILECWIPPVSEV